MEGRPQGRPSFFWLADYVPCGAVVVLGAL